jgi:hypothetical protein
MRSFHALLRVPVIGLSLVLGACPQTAPVTPVTASDARSQTGVDQASFGAFTDVPVPGSAEMDLDRTLLLGGREAWIGRLVLATPSSPSELFDFYRGEMPKFGWSEITVVRAEVSILTYTRLDRVATVQIKPGRFRGSEVNVTVSPRGPQGPPPAAGSSP